MKLFPKELSKTEEIKNYEDFPKVEDYIKQRNLLIKLFLKSKLRLLEIINFLPDAIIINNQEGKVIAWNQAMEELSNIKVKDIIGKSNYEYSLFLYEERRPILANLAIKSNEKWETNYINFKKEGDTLNAEVYVSRFKPGGSKLFLKAKPLYNLHGEIVGAIESIRCV